MSRYSGNAEKCPVCGLTYKRFNTGLTYEDVFERLKDYSDDSRDWQYKRRGTVLGKWFQIKQEGWKHHLEECEAQREFEANGGLKEGET